MTKNQEEKNPDEIQSITLTADSVCSQQNHLHQSHGNKGTMTELEATALRAHYDALLGIKESLKNRWNVTRGPIERSPILILQQELDALSKLKLIEFERLDYSKHRWGENSFDGTAILSHLEIVLARLKGVVDRAEATSPVQSREFPYIGDEKLRGIVERDYSELQKCLVNRCWKATIILSGGCVEAILTDALIKCEDKAKALPGAPTDKQKGVVKEIPEWGFVHIINAATKLGIVNKGVDTLSHSLREYRDLVHPSVEVRNKLKANEEEAKIAVAVLDMVHRDLQSINPH